MEIKRIWAMPSRWTFTIKPIKELLDSEMGMGMFCNGIWVDPFAGKNSRAHVTNDLNPKNSAKYHMDALDFLKIQKNNKFDGALFDPPFSPTQIKECYENIGKEIGSDKTRMSFWSQCKDEIARIVKPGGKVLCFGWNSMGLGKNRGFKMEKILLVPHGASRNDTIVTVEIKL